MPGPVFQFKNTVTESIDAFKSCEDVHEAWGCNGIQQQEERCNEHDSQHYKLEYQTTHHMNGKTKTNMEVTATIETKGRQISDQGIRNRDDTPERNMTCLKESQEDMELDGEAIDDDEMIESINIPVVEARLNVDIAGALTRQKIGSVQRGRTLSYADREDSQDAPTRRTRPLAYTNESMEIGGPLNKPYSEDTVPSLPPKTERNIKVSRNPSYHSAVRDFAVGSPQHVAKPETFNLQSSSTCSSSEGSPGHEPLYASTNSIEEMPAKSYLTSPMPKLEKNPPLDVPIAANMPRSASFSGGGILSPSSPANNSYRDPHGRRGSISQPSTPVTKRALPPIVVEKVTTNSDGNIPARGSAITRSFRRLFSTPAKSPSSSNAGCTTPEDFWLDLPDTEPSTPNISENRSTSRLRKLSTTLTRKLSTRSKMSNSYSFPTGTNGHQGITANGELPSPDPSTLVDYAELMKLFTCSGCQSIMSPPLHQCRKGHLVCNTCRFSLKQVCPVCKQRFSETTNLMMEQVCHLVKFPCKWSNSGCPEFHPPKSRLDHEHFCVYRPLHCHHASKGCPKVLLLRDMHQHLDECEFREK